MFKFPRIMTTIFVGTAIVGSVPVVAQDIIVTAHPTFRDLEFEYSGQDRIEVAKAAFKATIPVGTPTDIARHTIKASGANCGASAGNGLTKCGFSSFEGVEDHLHDVFWTIGVDSQEGRVVRLDISRASMGS